MEELANPDSNIVPWYWVPLSEVKKELVKTDSKGNVIWEWKNNWFFAFRDITNSTTERTLISTITPRLGMNNKVPIIYTDNGIIGAAVLCGIFSSLPFDFAVRQKVGGTSMNFFYIKQFPVLTPNQIPDEWSFEIVKRVAKLCYFNHDLDGWAEELWEELTPEQRAELPQIGKKEPFIYEPEQRAVCQAELDAIFAHLYGLTTEDLRYILDPEDVCGEGCVNETFRVLKDNETRQYGEYRTKRLVMEAWYKFGYDR